MTPMRPDHVAAAGLETSTDPAPSTETAFTGSTGAPSRRRIGLVAAGAAALIVVATATSLAASPAPSGTSGAAGLFAPAADPAIDESIDLDLGRFEGRTFRDITITAISGNDVTLATDDGWSRTITVTASIPITKGGQDAALTDLVVGDQVRFSQTRNADGSYTVTALAVVVPTVRGQASDITSSGFKVTTRDGSVWTVTVNGSTTYSYGTGTGSLADVTNGETVVVAGTSGGDNQLTALSVRVAADRAIGTVSAKTADSITITKRDGSIRAIHLDADTTFRVAGVATATLSDIAVDMAIGVTGRARADGSIDADAVVAGNGRGFFRGGGRGHFDRPGLGGPGFDLPGLRGLDVVPNDTAPSA